MAVENTEENPIIPPLCDLLLHNAGNNAALWKVIMAGETVLPGALTGNFHVRAIRPAFQDAHELLRRPKHRAILRRHSLKLRFWPTRYPEDETGKILDLDWSWISACKPRRIGELRIRETIDGNDNLRVIFFDPKIRKPIPTLWVLAVMQKKSNAFTRANITTFGLRRQLVIERFYGSSS